MRKSNDIFLTIIFVMVLVLLSVVIGISLSERKQKNEIQDRVVSGAIAIIEGQEQSWNQSGEYALSDQQLIRSNPDTESYLGDDEIRYDLIDAQSQVLLLEVAAADLKHTPTVQVLLLRGKAAAILCTDKNDRCEQADFPALQLNLNQP